MKKEIYEGYIKFGKWGFYYENRFYEYGWGENIPLYPVIKISKQRICFSIIRYFICLKFLKIY